MSNKVIWGTTLTKTYFTITSGRTGTAWLAEFLGQNLGFPAIHEPLGIEDYGVNMPDIKQLRSFNTYGNIQRIVDFWSGKFERIRQADTYIETNHTLAKAGLLENLVDSDLSDDATVIILRRPADEVAVSFISRGSFANITMNWQWHLHPNYPRKLVDFSPFRRFGQIGTALWYCFEMEARQSYYKLRYADQLNFIEVNMKDIVKPEGANAFWHQLGGDGECLLPGKKNSSSVKPPQSLAAQAKMFVQSANFNPDKIAQNALENGFSFAPIPQHEM